MKGCDYMELEELKVTGKIGLLYFSKCPNCKKFIINIKDDTVTCVNCRKKYKVEYPEE